MEEMTLSEARQQQDVSLDRLRRLQREQLEANAGGHARIQREIDFLSSEIRELDSIIGELLRRRSAKA